jgi:diguanylate cyclase (GGDEF)-like protein/PAS domain S-box-containing protein
MNGENKNYVLKIIEVLPDAAFAIDRDKKVIAWNRALEEMTNVRKEDILGRGDYHYAIPFYGEKRPILIDLIDTRDEAVESKYKYVKREGNTLFAEVFIPSLFGGKGAHVWVTASPIFDESGALIGAIETIRDITEKKLAGEKVKKLNEELLKANRLFKRLALRDSHTGLSNHRHFEEIIEAEFFRAKRYNHALSVIMLDIDYFKSINDVYGHQFGDLILKQLARQLKRLVRKYDIVCRLGGEEFVIISPATNRADALNLAHRILDHISLYDFGDKDHSVKLKLSLAVTSYPDDKVNKGRELINRADQILGKVKEFGGNNVYSSLDLKSMKDTLKPKKDKSADIKQLRAKIDRLTKKANQGLSEAIFAFAKTLELKDHYTGEHVEKTVHYATEVARALDLPQEETERIRQAAILHDLGKIGISERILLKKGKLTKKEFEEIKKHPQIGVDIIRPIQSLQSVVPLIFYHHERWDGKGYASRLKGEDIPVGARIIAVSDVYEALTSDRPYRKAYSEDEAKKIIKDGSGTQFDPKIVETFLKVLEEEK